MRKGTDMSEGGPSDVLASFAQFHACILEELEQVKLEIRQREHRGNADLEGIEKLLILQD